MQRLQVMLGSGLFLLSCAVAAQGQQQPTTVQLPTFSFFTVQTSVLVPDSGAAYLGGITRSQLGSRYRGTPFAKGPIPGSRGFNNTVQTGGMSVHATIIDHSEIDVAVLEAALESRGVPVEISLQEYAAAHLAAERAVKNPVADLRGATSLAEIKQAQQSAAESHEAEARELFAKAAAYEEKNQPGLAKIYYRMVVTRATGDLRSESLARIAVLERGHSAGTVATK